jgi:hypothetical protein
MARSGDFGGIGQRLESSTARQLRKPERHSNSVPAYNELPCILNPTATIRISCIFSGVTLIGSTSCFSSNHKSVRSSGRVCRTGCVTSRRLNSI